MASIVTAFFLAEAKKPTLHAIRSQFNPVNVVLHFYILP
jgi:hypothetical protein